MNKTRHCATRRGHFRVLEITSTVILIFGALLWHQCGPSSPQLHLVSAIKLGADAGVKRGANGGGSVHHAKIYELDEDGDHMNGVDGRKGKIVTAQLVKFEEDGASDLDSSKDDPKKDIHIKDMDGKWSGLKGDSTEINHIVSDKKGDGQGGMKEVPRDTQDTRPITAMLENSKKIKEVASRQLRGNADPVEIISDVKNIAKSHLEGIQSLQKMYQNGNEKELATAMKSMVANLRDEVNMEADELNDLDIALDFSDIDVSSLDTIPVMNDGPDSQVVEFFDPQVLNDMAEHLHHIIQLIEDTDVSLLSSGGHRHLEEVLFSQKSSHHKQAFEFDSDHLSFDDGSNFASNPNSNFKNMIHKMKRKARGKLPNIHKFLYDNEDAVNGKSRRLQVNDKNKRRLRALQEESNQCLPKCEPSNMTCNCENLFACVEEMTFSDVAVLFTKGYIITDLEDELFGNLAIDPERLNVYDAAVGGIVSKHMRLENMNLKDADPSDKAQCQAVLEEFHTPCNDPFEQTCSSPNDQSFQLSVDEVCSSVRTNVKLLFEVIYEIFETFDENQRAYTDGPYCGSISYASCAQFTKDFDKLYDLRDKEKYPGFNPMRRNPLLSLHDVEGNDVFNLVQFPTSYRFGQSNHGVQQALFPEVSETSENECNRLVGQCIDLRNDPFSYVRTVNFGQSSLGCARFCQSLPDYSKQVGMEINYNQNWCSCLYNGDLPSKSVLPSGTESVTNFGYGLLLKGNGDSAVACYPMKKSFSLLNQASGLVLGTNPELLDCDVLDNYYSFRLQDYDCNAPQQQFNIIEEISHNVTIVTIVSARCPNIALGIYDGNPVLRPFMGNFMYGVETSANHKWIINNDGSIESVLSPGKVIGFEPSGQIGDRITVEDHNQDFSRKFKWSIENSLSPYYGLSPHPDFPGDPLNTINAQCKESLADQDLSKAAMHTCDKSMGMLLGNHTSLGTLRSIVKLIEEKGVERMPGICCLDSPTDSSYFGFHYDPNGGMECQNHGPWHLGLSPEACEESAGGIWVRSPCVTLKECIDNRPKNGTDGFSLAFEGFAKDLVIGDPNDEEQCRSAREGLGFDADHKHDTEVCDAFNDQMCDGFFDEVDVLTEGLDEPPTWTEITYDPIEYPDDPELTFDKLPARDDFLVPADIGRHSNLKDIKMAKIKLENEVFYLTQASTFALEITKATCDGLSGSTVVAGFSSPVPLAKKVCTTVLMISALLWKAILSGITIAKHVYVVELEKNVLGGGEVWDEYYYVKSLYDNFKIADEWSHKALGTINKNIFKQHSEMRGQLQDRHEQMVNDVNDESVSIANELGDYIEEVANMIFQHHTTLLEALGADVIIGSAPAGNVTGSGRRLQKRHLPPDFTVDWPEGLSSFWAKLQQVDIKALDLKKGVVKILNALDIEVGAGEGEPPTKRSKKRKKVKHFNRRLATEAESEHGETSDVEAIKESIDAMKAMQAGMVSFVESKVSFVESKVEMLQADVVSKVNAIESKVETLQADMVSKVNAIETKVDAIESKMEAMQADLASNANAIESKMEVMMTMLSQLIEHRSVEDERSSET